MFHTMIWYWTQSKQLKISFALTSAPFDTKNSTTDRWPSCDAKWRGVLYQQWWYHKSIFQIMIWYWILSKQWIIAFALTSAPFETKNSTTDKWPFSDDKWRGVWYQQWWYHKSMIYTMLWY